MATSVLQKVDLVSFLELPLPASQLASDSHLTERTIFAAKIEAVVELISLQPRHQISVVLEGSLFFWRIDMKKFVLCIEMYQAGAALHGVLQHCARFKQP
jgi:hypothetical protein